MSKKAKLFVPCYYSFFANGMMALVLGAVMPYLIEEAGINYSVAGGLLSAFAIGNFLASFVNPPIVRLLGRKLTSVLLSALIPLSLLVITFLGPIPILYVACILLGIGRGTVSITNNMVVNDYDGTPAALSLLHTIFAIGAFLAPFLTGLFIQNGFNWRAIIYTIIILSVLSSLGYGYMPLDKEEDGKGKVKASKNQEAQASSKNFLKNIDFYIIGFILFFYLGAENCVNGWFVTYFKSTGIMTDSYATNLVSITWLVIMVGRLTTAYLSSKVSKQKLILINCLGTTVFFVLLISTTNLLLITLAVIGMGFFFAGIYPTCVSNGGMYIKGSTTGMSMLLAIAALGGIIAPQIIGVVADQIGMAGAIAILTINVVCMVVLAIVNVIRNNEKVTRAA
ncbi:MFS transporter [Sporanaerobium hydrogeniformans]|uniref:MFS transporter n=1 Tax=Sporanaerobium hydrogeniformans TaxID=3072179 RepID=A0AC61DAJ8_9FIRM|nr:MFS transporter [Sporanaerobium hydrogeniformans]PHV69696.1 MFS transporter [Sporanaerobium hydrogeniformans]